MTLPAAATTSSSDRRALALILLVVLAVLLSRWPLAATALRGSELTTDEPDLTAMALDRYFGVPMSNTHWPALPNQMLMVPVIGLDFLLTDRPKNANGFAAYAGEIYRDPARLVLLHRWLMIVLTTLASGFLMWTLRTRGLAVMGAAALLLQNAHLITYGTLGLGNGPALAAMIAMFPCCLRGRFLVAGLLLGVALSSRNTSVLVLPIVIGFAVERGRTLRNLGGIAVGMFAGSSLLWSHALLEPVRWAKANLGNFVKIGSPVGVRGALNVLMSAGGWWVWLLTGVSLILLLLRWHGIPVRDSRGDASRAGSPCHVKVAVVVGWMVAFLLAVVISARSPLVETRYFDAVVLGAAIVCLLAVMELGERWRTIVVCGAGAIAVLGWLGASNRFDASRAGLRPTERAVAASLHASPGERVIVDRSLLPFLRARATPQSLRELADQTESAMLEGAALREFVTRFRLSPELADIFRPNLTEKEQGEVNRLRVAAAALPQGEPIHVLAVGDSNSAARYGCPPVSAAPQMLRDGVASHAILLAASLAQLVDMDAFKVEPIGEGTYVRITRR